MNLTYSSREGIIHFIWDLHELKKAVSLIQLVAKEQQAIGNIVPGNIDDFDEILNTTESICLEFTFEFREFAISIIERMIEISDEQGMEESTRLYSFLDAINAKQDNVVN